MTKIVVIGGTGLVGSRLVKRLQEAGHDTLSASPASDVDTYTGEGLDDALDDADAVVDVSNAPSLDDDAVLDFFRTTSQRLAAAEARAGVGHHVVLSIVGTDRLQESGYFRGKLAQEHAVAAASVPYSIVRATQFFEFLRGIADANTRGDTVRLPAALVQPGAVDDVAGALVDVATGTPANGIVELAGPEAFRLDDLARRVLASTDDPRRVIADERARYFGATLELRSLVPGNGARLTPTPFEDWLRTAALVA